MPLTANELAQMRIRVDNFRDNYPNIKETLQLDRLLDEIDALDNIILKVPCTCIDPEADFGIMCTGCALQDWLQDRRTP